MDNLVVCSIAENLTSATLHSCSACRLNSDAFTLNFSAFSTEPEVRRVINETILINRVIIISRVILIHVINEVIIIKEIFLIMEVILIDEMMC